MYVASSSINSCQIARGVSLLAPIFSGHEVSNMDTCPLVKLGNLWNIFQYLTSCVSICMSECQVSPMGTQSNIRSPAVQVT